MRGFRLLYYVLVAQMLAASALGQAPVVWVEDAAEVPVVEGLRGWGLNTQGQTNTPGWSMNARSVAAGDRHSLALFQSGQVAAWGSNQYHQTDVPGALAAVGSATAIAAGPFSSMALKSDGTVLVWGDGTTVPAGLSGVKAIAAGGGHMMALKNDSTVVAWGYNSEGQADVLAGLTGVTAIAAGGYHSVVLKSDGTVQGWGRNFSGQTTTPAGLTGVVAVAAGTYHTLALKSDGTVVAWGHNEQGQINVPAGLANVVAIGAGAHQSAAVRADGSVMVWGDNAETIWPPPADLAHATRIAVGRFHFIAITEGRTSVGDQSVGGTSAAKTLTIKNLFAGPTLNLGTLTLEGENAGDFAIATPPAGTVAPQGQTTVGITFTPSSHSARTTTLVIPTNDPGRPTVRVHLVGNGLSPAGIDVPGVRALAPTTAGIGATVTHAGGASITERGIVYALTSVDDSPYEGEAGVTKVTTNGALGAFTVDLTGLAQGTSYTFRGYAKNIQGDSYSNAFTFVTPVASVPDIDIEDSSGANLSQSIAAWGLNASGQTTIPAGITSVKAFAAGYNFTIALKQDGTITSWGDNTYGQLLGSYPGAKAVAAGFSHSLVIKSDNVVIAQGYNGYNQLNVSGTTNAIAIAAGAAHSLVLKSNGTIVAAGDNSSGQTTVPASATGVIALAAGGAHSLALKSNGTVVAWGANGAGQTNVPGISDVIAIAAGDSHSMALRSNGSVAVWGDNTYGQGFVPGFAAPVVSIAAGRDHCVAALSNGSVIAWGRNNNAQTTVPLTITNATGVAAGHYHTLARSGRSLALGSRPIGVASTLKTVTITNRGDQPLTISSITLIGGNLADFTMSATPPSPIAPGASGAFTVSITPSAAGTRSTVLRILSNDPDEATTDISLSGTGSSAPTLASPVYSNVLTTTATTGGTVTSDGGGAITERGVVFARTIINSDPLIGGASVTKATTSGTTGAFTVNLSSLLPGVSYTFKAFATNESGTSYTAAASFTTSGPDIAITPPVSLDYGLIAVSSPSAAKTFTIRNVGTQSLTLQTPTITGADAADFSITTSPTLSLGTFVSTTLGITFTPGALGARTATLTIASDDADQPAITFTLAGTGAARPTITTPTFTNVTYYGAVLGGNVTDAGTSAITARGIVYARTSVNSNPQLGGNSVVNITASGTTGVFTAPVSGFVLPSTSYTFKAYATNIHGTSYTSATSFTTPATLSPSLVIEQPSGTALQRSVIAWGSNIDNVSVVPAGLNNIVAVDAGSRFSLALKKDGTVIAWGSNSLGQTTVPAGLANVKSLAAGLAPMVLKSDGIPVAWGVFAQPIPAGLPAFSRVSAGDLHAAGLDASGSVSAWGSDQFGQITVPAGLANVIAISAGGQFIAALKNDGTIVAWGRNHLGQTDVPAALGPVTSIAAGGSHMLALKNDGTISAWGGNTYGEATIPAGLSGVTAIDAGGNVSIALKNDGTVADWGYADDPYVAKPVGLKNIVSVAAGGAHYLALQAPEISFAAQAVSIASAPKNFTLRNGGDFSLNITSATITGANSADFAITAAPASTLTGGGQSTLGVTFTPSAIGPRKATLRIASNDTGDGVFEIALTGSGQTSASITTRTITGITHNSATLGGNVVNDGGGEIIERGVVFIAGALLDPYVGGAGVTKVTAPGASGVFTVDVSGLAPSTAYSWNAFVTTTFGTSYTPVGSAFTTLATPAPEITLGFTGGNGFRLQNYQTTSAPKTFTIGNIGTGPLTISSVTITGAQSSDFTLNTTGMSSSIAPGGSTTFTITFTPAATGPRNATLTIFNNDSDEATKTLSIGGVGNTILPVIITPAVADVTTTTATLGGNVTSNGGDALSLRGVVFSRTSVNANPVLSGSGVTDATISGDTGDFTVGITSLLPGTSYTFKAFAQNWVGESYSSALTFTTATVPPPEIEVETPPGTPLARSVSVWGPPWYGMTDVPAGLSDVSSIAAGWEHALALKRDGTVVVWGDNARGQLNIPAGLTDVTSIAAGLFCSFAVKADGTVVSWGAGDPFNNNAPVTLPAGLSNVKAIAAGFLHAVALKNDGTLVAWGHSQGGTTTIPAGLTSVKALAAGQNYTVALKTDGTVVAWGVNDYGETNVPAGLTGVKAIAACDTHTLALLNDGTVTGWGYGNNGETTIPEGLADVVSISAANGYSIAVKSDGTVVRWGLENESLNVPAGTNRVVSAVAASSHTLVLRSSAVQFASLPIGVTSDPQPVLIKNTGAGTLNLGAITIVGGASADFAIVGEPAASIAPGESTTFEVTFTPTMAGERNVMLRIPSNDDDESVVAIALTGTGVVLTHPPIGTDGSVAFDLDTPVTLQRAHFRFTDPDDDPQNNFIRVKITTLPTAGTLTYGEIEVAEGDFVTLPVPFIEPAFEGEPPPPLVFTPSGDQSEVPYATLTFQVEDDGAEGYNLDLTPRTLSFTLPDGSSPPEGTDNTLTLRADEERRITLADLGFSDPHDTPPDNFTRILISSLPTSGWLAVEGSWWEVEEGDSFDIASYPTGERWIESDTFADNWRSVTSSADGQVSFAVDGGTPEWGWNGSLRFSTNGGLGWGSYRSRDRFWTDAALSADGETLVAVDAGAAARIDEVTAAEIETIPDTTSRISISTDRGYTFTTHEPGGNYVAVAISADAQKIFALDAGNIEAGGQIHVTTDGGQTWALRGDALPWRRVAASADGTRVIAAATDGESPGALFTSGDSGTTWTMRAVSARWSEVASSADGMRLIAVASNLIAISTDGGASWDENETFGAWTSVASSADGMKLVITSRSNGEQSGRIMMSDDGGETWTPKGPALNWTGIASSADGSRLVALSERDYSSVLLENDFLAAFEFGPQGGQIFSSSDQPKDRLLFIPDYQGGEYDGPPTASFTFQVMDDAEENNIDLEPNTLTFNITPAANMPEIESPSFSNITDTSASLAAIVTSNGGGVIFARGFRYIPTAEIESDSWWRNTSMGGNATGPFSINLTSLIPGTHYTARAYVSTRVGTAYTEDFTFTTTGVTPPLAVGNLIFFDRNNNGHADAGEGVNGVRVELFRWNQNPASDTPVAFAITSGGGRWLIDDITTQGEYSLRVPPSMFATSAPLWHMKSMEGYYNRSDDNDGEDGQDAEDPAITGIVTSSFYIEYNNMPAGEDEQGIDGDSDDDRDGHVDLTRDLGFIDVTDLPVTFQQWQQRRGITGGGNGNHDHDAYDDLLEYALGIDADERSLDGQFAVDDDHATDRTHIILRRRHGSQNDITFTVQVCPDLSGAQGGWTGTVITPVITNNGDGTETLTFPDVTTDPALVGFNLGFTRLIITLDANGDGTPEATTTTEILGWQHRPLAVQAQTYGLPFVRPAVFTGAPDDASGSVLNLATAAGTSSIVSTLVTGEHYYVEVISGDNEGQRFEVDETATTANTIALLPADTLSTSAVVPANIDGDMIALRPHWRVKDLFPVADFTATRSSATADQIQIWKADNSGYASYFLLNHPTSGRMWVRVGDSNLTSQSDRIMGPADGLFARPRAAVIAAMDGQVRTWKFACPLRPGNNFIGNPYPVAQSFSARLMSVAGGFTGSNSSTNADKISLWTGDTAAATFESYYLLSSGALERWVKSGDAFLTDHTNDNLFGISTATFINSKLGHPTWIMPSPIAP